MKKKIVPALFPHAYSGDHNLFEFTLPKDASTEGTSILGKLIPRLSFKKTFTIYTHDII